MCRSRNGRKIICEVRKPLSAGAESSCRIIPINESNKMEDRQSEAPTDDLTRCMEDGQMNKRQETRLTCVYQIILIDEREKLGSTQIVIINRIKKNIIWNQLEYYSFLIMARN